MQTTIIGTKDNFLATKEEFFNILRMVAPGTNLRSALNGIVDAKKGALIVIDKDNIAPLIDGGFKINCRFTPQRLIELSKMDGAIILSKDIKRIIYANVTLAPDTKIPTKETGTRHKAAERTAKSIGTLAIAISERKNEINLYYKNLKYHLRNTSEILRSATETLQILEKQKELFDRNLEKLDYLELNGKVDIKQACRVIQNGKAIEKILESQERTFIELGNEALPLRLRVKEIANSVPYETDLVIKDYALFNYKKSQELIDEMSYEDLNDLSKIEKALGQNESNYLDEPVKGWRILSKTVFSEKEIALLLSHFNNLRNILNSGPEKFKEVLGEEKSRLFEIELNKIIS
ncbi:MAG: DNA integrity scanning diadenylate cyclase DisA [Candidatus Pacearchaeota archaeon]